MRGKLLFLGLILASLMVRAQTPIRCLSDEKLQEHLSTFPGLNQVVQEAEANYLRKIQQGTISNGNRAVKTIPVVVHIIQETPTNRITDARVLTQIDVLNEDFRKIAGTNGDGGGVDTEIEFCLASIDPNGCPTTGINRIVNAGLAVHEDEEEFQLKSLSQWDPEMYLNIWVPKTITGGILGYATFPFLLNSAPQLDGVVISGTYFGRGEGTPPTSYNLGRTCTHEVGHWLGLFHTFQGGCSGNSPSTCAGSGDRVCDTPPTASSNFGCPGPQNTCTETPTDLPDQTENYMDYVDDFCMDTYTQGQKDRMESFLNDFRDVLWSPSNLTATGCDGTTSPGCVPTVRFAADLRSACVGSTINFSDLSSGLPTTWEWTFQGGTPATANTANPSILYDEPGTYTVSLTVTNSLGQDSETQTAYIEVLESRPTPWAEGFEAVLFYPLGWVLENEDQAGTWEIANGIGYNSNKSMVAKNYDWDANGSRDFLISEVIDLEYADSAALRLNYAYKIFNAFRLDTFRIRISNDCGLSYTTLFQETGSDLATVPGLQVPSGFVPADSSEWGELDFDITAWAGSPNIRVMFENVGRNGQNIYFDNINIAARIDSSLIPVPPDTTPVAPASFSFIPLDIPFSDELSFQVDLPSAGTLSLELYDLEGRRIFRQMRVEGQAGSFEWMIPADLIENILPGVYLYRLESDFGTQVGRVLRMR